MSPSDRTMDSADEAAEGDVAVLRAVGDRLANCETVPDVASTAVETVAVELDATGVALCTDGEYAAVAGEVPGTPPAVPEDTPTTAAVPVGSVDRPRVGSVGEWGTLWIWADAGPATATVAALADRIGAAVARTSAERDRDRLDDRIETVASVVNHDLNNPLTIADGYLDVVRMDVDSDHLDAVDDALDRIDGISDAVVTIARDGRRVDETRAIPLERLADDAWRRVDGAGDLDATSATVRADPDRLLTLFERLFDNAVRFCDDPTITVRATETAVVVADDGPGLPPDRWERALEPGYSTADGQSGLGLAVVEWLADAHRWSVSLRESEVGGLAVVLDGVDVSEPSA